VLTYPEIRGVLAEMEEEFRDSLNKPQQESFARDAIFVLAMVDRRLSKKIQEKSSKNKKKFLF
jgi:hypothetical protein